MFVAERFIANLVKNHGKHPVSTKMEALVGIHHQLASS
jgi:hypothetical protein